MGSGRGIATPIAASGAKDMVRIGVLGAAGRMGQALAAVIAATPGVALSGGVERAGHAAVGAAFGSGLIGDDITALAASSDILVDFTVPAALAASLTAARAGNCALLVGTTGLKPADHAAIDAAASGIAVLQATNTSLGVNLLAVMVEQAARVLGSDWDIEIVEMHHRHKLDAPSGTALSLGEAAARGRGVDLVSHSERGRDGIGEPRSAGAIGFASLRGGSVAGDHMVVLAADGERIELGHRAENREIFARGAVKAAQWLAGRPAGRYRMIDVLGL